MSGSSVWRNDFLKNAIDDDDVIYELALEANTKFINTTYHTGFVLSSLILGNFAVRALLSRGSAANEAGWARPGVTLAFSLFKNERSAIEEHMRQSDVKWIHVQLDLKRLTGLDFRAAFCAGARRSPTFFTRLINQRGFSALRRVAYPFIGYGIFTHVREKFSGLEPKGTVVTTNLTHPVSIAIHSAAVKAGWRTIYLEHAMTPRMIARDLGYSTMLVRSGHTKEMLVDSGIPRERVEVLPYWGSQSCPAPINAAEIRRLGFAINGHDSLDDTAYLVARFRAKGIRCEIRVHDADKRLDTLRSIGARLGVQISSAAASDITEFIARQDLVVVGNSSVLLDCLRAKVPAIYFWSGEPEIFDYYGLVQYMKYPFARSRDELLRMLAL
jgi:hypothetical protein